MPYIIKDTDSPLYIGGQPGEFTYMFNHDNTLIIETFNPHE